jgi:hypothetical protein
MRISQGGAGIGPNGPQARHYSLPALSLGRNLCYSLALDALVAHLDRVLGYEPRGREFESLRARQIQGLQRWGPFLLFLKTVITQFGSVGVICKVRLVLTDR